MWARSGKRGLGLVGISPALAGPIRTPQTVRREAAVLARAQQIQDWPASFGAPSPLFHWKEGQRNGGDPGALKNTGDESRPHLTTSFPRKRGRPENDATIANNDRLEFTDTRPPMSLKNKTLFITGASRGIGLAIALRAARDGANIAIAAKIEQAGGRALPLVVDVREEEDVKSAIAKTAAHFGGIDIVVNNASAIQLTPVEHTEMRRYDRMQQINARGTFMVSKYAIPHLAKAANPHILMLSPPLDMQEKWFAPHTAYSMAKFGMSLVVLGLAGELRSKGIAVNALWPRTTIATSAIKNLLGGDAVMRMSRTPDILADAAYAIFHKPSKSFTGQFLIDDSFLASEGVTDFEKYRVDASQPLAPDFFVPETPPPPPGVVVETKTDRWELPVARPKD
jgi:citronellol/citronellal dehydrogenase